MATHADKLADSLSKLMALAGENKRAIYKSNELSRVHRERLIGSGFLREIKPGWLLLTDPSKDSGESTIWYAHFWDFVSQYMQDRFRSDYCLSAESSILLHTGSTTVPAQVTATVKRDITQKIDLPFGASIFVYPDAKNMPEKCDQINGIKVMNLAEAIYRLPRSFYEQNPVESTIALMMIRDPSALLYLLLEYGATTKAGYLIAAFEQINRPDIAGRIKDAMTAANHRITPENPFTRPLLIKTHTPSPYVNRLLAMWQSYRSQVEKLFPNIEVMTIKPQAYLAKMEERFTEDAYNSLSIEGYNVTENLIEQIRMGKWNPSDDKQDRGQSDALAAKGYRQSFKAVERSLEKAFSGQNPGSIFRQDLHQWYQALFSPAVQAGLIRDYELAGYRHYQVYIRNSRHIPFPPHAVVDGMEALFDLLKTEENPYVRAILGHFFFVYIHPFTDGNGRLGRFLMNFMLGSAGIPWTVVPVSRRQEYMTSLEQASCHENIENFALFIRSLM